MTIQGSDSAQNLTLCTGGGNVGIGTAADNTHKMKVSGSSLFDGNVGIGGYNAGYKLYVSGGANISTSLLVNGMDITKENGVYKIYTDGTSVYTDATWYGTWQSGSDIRLKDATRDVNADVDDIALTPIFDFTWKDKKRKGEFLGTEAQYIQKLFPHAVTQDNDGYLAMDYGATALAAAVMTARRVVDHEARIKQLEKEIELLKAMQA